MVRETLFLALGIAVAAAMAACAPPGQRVDALSDIATSGPLLGDPLTKSLSDTSGPRVPVAEAPAAVTPTVAPPGPPVRPYTDVRLDDAVPGAQRARHAIETRTPIVTALFAEAGAQFPPDEIVLRVFKDERLLEVWATATDAHELVHVTTYGVCAMSGELGPKRKEGDRQVPEGFYKLQYLWPDSAFYLAMKVGYPNLSDRALGDPLHPGSDIMIHGGCASIGCIALTDERIEELWAIVSTVKLAALQLQIFPTRDFDGLVEHPAFSTHGAFWADLEAGYRAFEATRRPVPMDIGRDGRYVLRAAGGSAPGLGALAR